MKEHSAVEAGNAASGSHHQLCGQGLNAPLAATALPPVHGALKHRAVREEDLAAVCTFPQNAEELFFLFPAAEYPLTPAQLSDAIARRSDSTVVERDGEVLAFANFYRWGDSCAIGNVIVAPAARGQGVGRHLVEAMATLAVSRHGAGELTVSCFNGNLAGLLFYPRLGFRPYAIEARRDRRGEPVALLHLRRALA